MKLVLALLVVLLVHLTVHRKSPQRTVIGYSGGHWTEDCVREGFDAFGRAHPNGGRA